MVQPLHSREQRLPDAGGCGCGCRCPGPGGPVPDHRVIWVKVSMTQPPDSFSDPTESHTVWTFLQAVSTQALGSGVPKTRGSTQAADSSGKASPLVTVKPRFQLHSQGSDVEPSWSGSSCRQQAVGTQMSRIVIRAMPSGLVDQLAF